MSALETPPATRPAQEERRCPQCGAHLSAEQEWCLDCGSAVGTRIASPRGWRVPFAVVGSLLALALIALVLALVELAGNAEHVQEVAGTPTPAPSAAAPVAPATTPAGAATTAPPPAATPTPAAAGNLATWPTGRTAWTVILGSSGTRANADRLATEAAGKGVPGVGVLDSGGFESLGSDSFVVFAGQYANRRQAAAALATFRDRAGGGTVRRVVPRHP